MSRKNKGKPFPVRFIISFTIVAQCDHTKVLLCLFFCLYIWGCNVGEKSVQMAIHSVNRRLTCASIVSVLYEQHHCPFGQ